jgi:hypothetical protein
VEGLDAVLLLSRLNLSASQLTVLHLHRSVLRYDGLAGRGVNRRVLSLRSSFRVDVGLPPETKTFFGTLVQQHRCNNIFKRRPSQATCQLGGLRP